MLGFMKAQWIATNGIREIIDMAVEDVEIMPNKQQELIKTILEISRDLRIPMKQLSGHEQVIVTMLVFFGISDVQEGQKWVNTYASRHNQEHVLPRCISTANTLIRACR